MRFGHFQQSNLGIIPLDLSTISRHTGTEVSGFLGFAMLRQLEVEFDYRDGLVDFKYDPKRVPLPSDSANPIRIQLIAHWMRSEDDR